MNIKHDVHAHGQHAAPVAGGVKDPVCGMTVDPQTTPHRSTHAANDYFCGNARDGLIEHGFWILLRELHKQR